jgi:hypothetical protein
MFANDNSDRRKATAQHVHLMMKTNVSAYFASKRRTGTGKTLNKEMILYSAVVYKKY